MSDEPTKVAVACQGGGSHTAFTAGALRRFLADAGEDFELVAFTGTSGGALCAVTTWYGLRTADAATARRALRDLWVDLAASGPLDAVTNYGVVTASRLLHGGAPIPQISPAANVYARLARGRLRRAIESQVDPDVLADLVADATDDDPPAPKVLVSAVDATDGTFEVFTDRPAAAASDRDAPGRIEERPKPLSIDAVLASTAVPNLFEPVRMREEPGGPIHDYWDGLLSQNPPIRNLLDGPDRAARKPDEIWLIRVNPTVHRGDLSALDAILDRRNELAGSLSLAQELHFVDRVNQWLRDETFAEAARERYKPVVVRQVELDEARLDGGRTLGTASKLDRRPAFVKALLALGEAQAAEFLAARERGDAPLVGASAAGDDDNP